MSHFGNHRCGGSIIAPQKIVTAAHCIRGTITSFLAIRAGSTYHATGGVVISVRRTFEHEDYNVPFEFTNDIGLLFLSESLIYGLGIGPIALAEQDDILPGGLDSTITGWGTLQQGAATIPDNLQSVVVPIVDQDECVAAYANHSFPADVTDVMICAGVPEGGRDACQGDSGGPLTVGRVLHGAVSWGYGCAQPGLPGVYARVASFRNWIDNINV